MPASSKIFTQATCQILGEFDERRSQWDKSKPLDVKGSPHPSNPEHPKSIGGPRLCAGHPIHATCSETCGDLSCLSGLVLSLPSSDSWSMGSTASQLTCQEGYSRRGRGSSTGDTACGLKQWFSSFREQQNHLEGLLKCISFRSSRSGVEPDNWHFQQVPGEAGACFLGTTL